MRLNHGSDTPPFFTDVSYKTFTSLLTKCVAGLWSPSDGNIGALIGESNCIRFSTSSRIPAKYNMLQKCLDEDSKPIIVNR